MDDINELRKDAAEARALLSSATRTRWKDMLAKELVAIEAKIKIHQSSYHQDSTNSNSNKSPSSVIRNYSWDQSDKFLKVYVTLNGVESLTKENIAVNFGEQNLSLQVSNLDGKNWELTISKLAYKINENCSHFKVKKDLLVLFAAKAIPKTWEAVTGEEKRAKDKKAASKPDAKDSSPDAMGSLMGLMKNMYDDGDDDMKRMLNKTWYESQNKANGMASIPGMADDMAGDMADL